MTVRGVDAVGRVLSTTYDNLNQPTAVGGGGTQYISNAAYWPHGELYSYLRGNQVGRAVTYNSRLQPTEIDEAVGASSASFLLVLCPDWGLGGYQGAFSACKPAGTPSINTANNGNLLGIAEKAGNGVAAASLGNITQTFTYDGVNRLSTFQDGSRERDFGYDAYGNMWVTRNDAGLPMGINPSPAGSLSDYNANNNRLTANGATYDAAGNQTKLGTYALEYDAESRQVKSTLDSAATTYEYDGDGRRVSKTANGITTLYVYNVNGLLKAEYTDGTAVAESCGTCYLSQDHLGSTRMVMDEGHQVIERHDYMPFGEEIISGYAGRANGWGSNGTAVNQKFTGKERDAESGLDYFGARY